MTGRYKTVSGGSLADNSPAAITELLISVVTLSIGRTLWSGRAR